jgi:hypothetical protein
VGKRGDLGKTEELEEIRDPAKTGNPEKRGGGISGKSFTGIQK